MVLRHQPRDPTPVMSAPITDHKEVATIRRPGIVCVITARVVGGASRLSFSFYKEYDKGGETRQTHWLEKRHAHVVAGMMEELIETLERIDDEKRSERRTNRP